MNQQEKDILIQSLREMDIIEEVVSSYKIDLKRLGEHKTAPCPFHGGSSGGSFMVTPKKRMYNCFSCGAGGDVIKFVSEIEGISYFQAALKLGETYRLIKKTEGYVKPINFKKIERMRQEVKEEVVVKATDEELDAVYNIFLDLSVLNVKHRDMLIKDRGLSNKTIDERKYRSYPDKNIMDQILKEMLKQDIPEITLQLIPGFYRNKIENKWIFTSGDGLLIPIRNYKGQVIALQIRKDKRTYYSDNRYTWFSSSFAKNSKERLEFGISPGAPMDVLYPNRITNKTIFITEGRFKAEKIAEKWGSVVISVQGVNNWRGIDRLIKDIESETKKGIAKFKFMSVYVAFDSDFKYQVLKQALTMMQEVNEKTGIKCLYLDWDGKLGKGIDDLINSCQDTETKITKININDFKEKLRKEKEERLEIIGEMDRPQQVIGEALVNTDRFANREYFRQKQGGLI